VITTKVPALYELVRDCPAVRFVEPELDEYLEALEVLMRDNKNMEKLPDVAKQFVEEHFNCAAEAERLAALYEAILNKSMS
jgi:glycosyltransferase involved in cell wall biosynthesis